MLVQYSERIRCPDTCFARCLGLFVQAIQWLRHPVGIVSAQLWIDSSRDLRMLQWKSVYSLISQDIKRGSCKHLLQDQSRHRIPS